MILLEAAVIRFVNDCGRVAGNLRRGHVLGITERFDYFTTGESIRHERMVAGAKLIAWIALALFILA